jgi:hypothetical protein
MMMDEVQKIDTSNSVPSSKTFRDKLVVRVENEGSMFLRNVGVSL